MVSSFSHLFKSSRRFFSSSIERGVGAADEAADEFGGFLAVLNFGFLRGCSSRSSGLLGVDPSLLRASFCGSS